MTKPTTIGIDLAKRVFQVAILTKHHKLTFNKPLSRNKLIEFMAQQPQCLVGLEACGASHYWSGVFAAMGHTVKLLPPAYVKGFVYGNKNDTNDAKAIALAAVQPESPTVCTKTPDQLAIQALLRVRDRRIRQRVTCMNQLRGLLAEHGLVIPKGIRYIRQIQLDQIAEVMRPLISTVLDEFNHLDKLAIQSDKAVQQRVNAHPVGQRLLAIPGFGPINALTSLVNNPADYNNGRHYAAYLGLAPKQAGTGGRIHLQGVSKRGNDYQRQMLCHGARAFLTRRKQARDPLLIWAKRIQAKKGTNVAVCALANKLARISWSVMNGKTYCVTKAVSPMTD